MFSLREKFAVQRYEFYSIDANFQQIKSGVCYPYRTYPPVSPVLLSKGIQTAGF